MNTSASPTHRAERIGMLDTTRGIAVLGILLMNIAGAALPDAYENPNNWGGAEGLNLWAWRINAVLFEGTMRGLFTLLFGAGALLFLQRLNSADRPEGGPRGTTLYYRRTALLIVFGLINAYVLLWEGDILFYYGVVGLFLYFFRNWPTRRLILIAVCVLTIPTILNFRERAEYVDLRQRAEAAQMAFDSGTPIDDEQLAAIDELEQVHRDHQPAIEELEYVVELMRTSYSSAFHYLKPRIVYWETTFFVRYGFAECLGMMLLGMALLKLGILTGSASRRTYATLLVVGYAIGLSVNLWEMRYLESTAFSVPAIMDTYVTYDSGRIPMTLGHLGLLGLFWQAPALIRTKRVLGAVGRMALTNYLSQSVICTLIFTGAGLALYGQLERHELYYVVAAVWAVQVVWSGWWLRRFRFGPMEWVWRSLTYGQRQPMRLQDARGIPVDQTPST